MRSLLELMQAIELTWSVFAHHMNKGTATWRGLRDVLSATHPALTKIKFVTKSMGSVELTFVVRSTAAEWYWHAVVHGWQSVLPSS
jgi:hypothetical protein